MAIVYKITFNNGKVKFAKDKVFASAIISEYLESCQKITEDGILKSCGYKVEEIDANDINIKSYQEAINIIPVLKTTVEVDNRNTEAILALDKLLTITKTQNEIDEFVPNLFEWTQHKFFPLIRPSDKLFGLTCRGVGNREFNTVNIGSLFWFKTPQRAEQFGTQFKDLIKDLFEDLFR